jgi:hypothetical protein
LRPVPAIVFLSENMLTVRLMCSGVAGHGEKGTNDTSDNNFS